jgi:hypothetical protein
VRTRFFQISGAVHTLRRLARLPIAGDDRLPGLDLREPAKTPHQNPESLEGSRKCQIKNDGSMRSSTVSGMHLVRLGDRWKALRGDFFRLGAELRRIAAHPVLLAHMEQTSTVSPVLFSRSTSIVFSDQIYG